MYLATSEYNLGSTKYISRSNPYHAGETKCANAEHDLETLSHCFAMLILEFATLLIRRSSVRVTGSAAPLRSLYRNYSFRLI